MTLFTTKQGQAINLDHVVRVMANKPPSNPGYTLDMDSGVAFQISHQEDIDRFKKLLGDADPAL